MNKDNSIDKKFDDLSQQKLHDLALNNKENVLLKIKYDNLSFLVQYLINYKPKSKIREEKRLVLDYLILLNNKDLQLTKPNELKWLERIHITPIINKLNNRGFRFKNAWLLLLVIILIFDLVIFYLLKEYFVYIPFLSIMFSWTQIRKDVFAKKEKKLW